jgi:Zn-dependent peptidase ImmA (M78 family)
MIVEKIEAQAEELLAKFEVRIVPTPIEELVRALGIRISRAPSAEFSGLLIRKDGHALIGVNSSEAPARQRFTIAHEIAHFILHPQKDAFVDFRKEWGAGEAKPSRERHADMFAAALLMPRKTLLKDFRRLAKDGYTDQVILTLAKQYAVSEDAMRYRLINLISFPG